MRPVPFVGFVVSGMWLVGEIGPREEGDLAGSMVARLSDAGVGIGCKVSGV